MLNISREFVGVATTEIALGEARPSKDCALEIVLVRPGDTLWDIAKRLGMSVADLSAQNPQLSVDLKPGDKIVAFAQEENS